MPLERMLPLGWTVGRAGGSWNGSGIEETDKRSWQTLPDEIHVARAWVPPGQYHLTIRPSGQGATTAKDGQTIVLAEGQTMFIVQRVMQ